MARYAPIPASSIDVRSEAERLRDAKRRVLEASGGQLNDFSAGNPLSALLEGQVFAEGEFLFWANRLPDKILEEWIGPFLGGMRRLGTPAVAQLEVEFPPEEGTIVIPEGTEFEATGSDKYVFLTTREHLITPGDVLKRISVVSKYVGSQYNVPANTITKVRSPGFRFNNVRVTNPQPAGGGSDVESIGEVKSRFLSRIRRRNPISEADWVEFFIDLYGIGTTTVVKPNRSSRFAYRSFPDFSEEDNKRAISFFVLGPEGVELNSEQLKRGQALVNFSVFHTIDGYLYPMTLDDVQINLTLDVDAMAPRSSGMEEKSLAFRNTLFSILTPGVLFPVNSSPSVGEIESAFNSSVAEISRFKDPRVVSISAYNTPVQVARERALFSNIYEFEGRDNLIEQDDLIRINAPSEAFFPALTSFTPQSSSKLDQAVAGNLKLRKIYKLVAGEYHRGQVVYHDGEGLRVVLESIILSSETQIDSYISQGKISAVKSLSFWGEEESYVATVGSTYDPQIIAFDYDADSFIPTKDSHIALDSRPDGFVWLVEKNFTLPKATNNLTGAQTEFLVGASTTVRTLIPGSSYTSGEWVRTPLIGSGPAELDRNLYYIDQTLGAVEKFAKVLQDFTAPSEGSSQMKELFDTLVEEGNLKEVIVREGDDGLPIGLYSPRFKVGTYLEYRETASSDPTYYIAATSFTPNSRDVDDLVEDGLVIQLALDEDNKEYLADGIADETVREPSRLFKFFRGDQSVFRSDSRLFIYEAQESVTPLFDFEVYFLNGVFKELSTSEIGESTEYISFFGPKDSDERENVLTADGKGFFRVMREFTPAPGETLEDHELLGNVLRIVNKFDCSDRLSTSLGDVSALSLGRSVISLGNSARRDVFVWESTKLVQEEPRLLWEGKSLPPSLDYGDGTLAL